MSSTVSFDGQAPFAAAALALCNDDQFVVTHSELHTRLQRTEPSKPGQGSPLPHTLSRHTLLLAVTVSVTHCWVCPPWDIGSISCSETIKFFQPQSVYSKAKPATKLRCEIGLYFCFLHCTRERWKTPNCASKLSFSRRREYRIRGSPELNHCGSVVKTQAFTAMDLVSIPGWETWIPKSCGVAKKII